LGLAKKDLLPNQDEGKNHLEGLGFGPISKKEGQDDKQVGGTAAEQCLEQNPETGSRTILQTGAGASSGQLQNSGHWKTEQVKPWIHQPHKHVNILSLIPLIKFLLM